MSELETLCKEMERTIERVWCNEPADITRLRHGIMHAEAGSFGQSYSTMVFALVYTLTMGEHVVFGLVKEANAESIPVSSLEVMTRSHFGEGFNSAQFIGYVLAPDAEKFAAAVVSLLPELTTHEQYSRVLGLYLTYLNILHWWLHIYFPWHVGEMYPQMTEQRFAELGALFDSKDKV